MIIDSYVHVGLPRFQSVADCRAVMDHAGIGKAIVCPFESCPDLATVHQAISESPETFRAAGIPLGANREETELGVRAQLRAGFAGLRLSGEDVRDRPWLLDLLGQAHAFALVCGNGGLAAAAPALLRYLDRYEDALVIGGHFAGPTDPVIFDELPAVAELFAHERFAVVLSRQGLFPAALMRDWAAELIERVGYSRLLWGSEAPVLHWRDEPMERAIAWMEQFGPTEAERAALMAGNAERLVFARPVPPVAPLRLPFDPRSYTVSSGSPMWPHGLPLDTALSGRLLHGWLEWGGGKRGPLRDYLRDVLRDALPQVPVNARADEAGEHQDVLR